MQNGMRERELEIQLEIQIGKYTYLKLKYQSEFNWIPLEALSKLR